MSQEHVATLCIMAGGTGGHVFPGIAIAESLRTQGINVTWMGTKGGMEAKWVNDAQIPFDCISIKGLRGNGLKGWLLAPINIWRAFLQARAILKKNKASVVLGMGGFVCGPGGLAAKSLGLTLVLHEQNAIAGMTNRLLTPLAKQVITAFPTQNLQSDKVIQLGNPIRAGFEQIPVLLKKTTKRILVVGGSRGAQALNQSVPEALQSLNIPGGLKVVHQSGERGFQEAKFAYQQCTIPANIHVTLQPFINDMREAYEEADLVICRSGALTVSELMAAARPAIMVPYPHAVDDHQTANAQALVELKGGEVIQQSELSAERLIESLNAWLQDDERLTEASMSIRLNSPKQVTEKISDILLLYLKNSQ